MSATNRGSIRRESDFYKTPESTIRSLFDVLYPPGGSEMCDPCAGDGRIIRVFKERYPWFKTFAVEIRPEERENLEDAGTEYIHSGIDFLEIGEIYPIPRVFITNPPYSIAQKVIEHCFEIAPDAEVIMLLRQGFFSSKARKPFWDKHPVTQLYPLVERPSFGASVKCKKCDWRRFYHLGEDYPRRCPECGANIQVSKTDACDYAWFVWSKYREQKIEVIIRRDENVCES